MPPHRPVNTPPPAPSRAPQTPRKRKPPTKRAYGVDSRRKWSTEEAQKQLTKALSLSFIPDTWQLVILSKIMEGYDSIIVAGTGYGKSLLFEGMAALGGKDKVVIVICPLKALEVDQVASARKKGIDAVTINEDTPDSEKKSLWKRIRTTASMVYISPEMALSKGFISMWTDKTFRKRLTGIVVDEAHCIEEWGKDFRKEYALLCSLRTYTGQQVPIVACTATCATKTFDIIWSSLGYGCRPFFGIDVGCDRPNLFYHTRTLTNLAKPVLDLLNLMPSEIGDDTQANDISKTLVYVDSEAQCREIRDDLRRLLPADLRSSIRAFSSDLSETGKRIVWEELTSGKTRVVVATDAAGMGCNVADIENTVIINCPKSFSMVSQRWGRAGRDRTTLGMCLLLVPQWAFRPKAPLVVPAVAQAKGKKKKAEDSASNIKKRENLAPALEKFINLDDKDCNHKYLREHFRPVTHLDVRTSLAENAARNIGYRAQGAAYELIWIVLDLGRTPVLERCCGRCNQELTTISQPSNHHDDRLFTYANDFLFPSVPPRPSSSASSISQVSNSSSFKPLSNRTKVPKEQKDRLRALLETWRETRHLERGVTALSSQVALPPKILETLVSKSHRFLQFRLLEAEHILSVVRWDSATQKDLEEVSRCISDWRDNLVAVHATPPSQRRASKKTRHDPTAPPVRIAQPNFGVLPESLPAAASSTVGQDPFDETGITENLIPIPPPPRPRPRPSWNRRPMQEAKIIPQAAKSSPSRNNQNMPSTPLQLDGPRRAYPSPLPTPFQSRVQAMAGPSSLRHAYSAPAAPPVAPMTPANTNRPLPINPNNSNSAYYRIDTPVDTSKVINSQARYYRSRK